jgi:hypothetical protein
MCDWPFRIFMKYLWTIGILLIFFTPFFTRIPDNDGGIQA